MRVARVLLARARDDAPSPLRRIVCAALARALDALMRDEICELSDALVAVADNVPSAHDQRALAEASMIVDFQRSVTAYARADARRPKAQAPAAGKRARRARRAGRAGAGLPWASTLRVSALRQGLLRFARELETVAGAPLARGAGRDRAAQPGRSSRRTVFSLAQLTVGARRRLIARQQRPVPRERQRDEHARDDARAADQGPGRRYRRDARLGARHARRRSCRAAIAAVSRIVLDRMRGMSSARARRPSATASCRRCRRKRRCRRGCRGGASSAASTWCARSARAASARCSW